MKSLLLMICVSLVALFLWVSTARPEGGCPGVTSPLNVISGFQQITVSTTAVGLTVPRGARLAVVQIEDAAIRYRDDGTDPTASVGAIIADGGGILVCSPAVATFKMIRKDASDAKANVSYYGG